jgi:hypothetical protein
MLRGADYAELAYAYREIELWDNLKNVVRFEPPHPRLMLVRFPAGDGGEAGIECF